MRRLHLILVRIVGLFAGARHDRELAAELEAHLQLHADEYIRAGLTPAVARQRALLKLGGLEQTKERYRDQRGIPSLEGVVQDLRYAMRALRRNPTFAAVAGLTLALGIGANTAIFSIVDGVLLRPAPFTDLPRLMMLWETDRKSGTTREPSSIPDYLDFRERSQAFERLAAIAPAEVNLTGLNGEPRRLAALAVTAEFLPMVGVPPLAGRTFTADEDRPGGPRAAIISQDLAAELVGSGAGEVVGRTIRLNDVERTVGGVMPRGADFGTLQLLGAADYSRGFAERGGRVKVDVWLPLAPNPSTASRDNHPIFVLGRLAAPAAIAAAQEEMTRVAADLERTHPSNAARGVFVEPFEHVVFGPVRPALYVLLFAVALVLLVACTNVANLLLVRASDREREVTVRAALGAGMGRLARQFFAEGAVLASAGGALGVALAYWGLETLLALAPPSLPRVEMVGLDARVLGATLAILALVALAFGAFPLLYVRRVDLQQTLRGASGAGASSGLGGARLRSGLVVAELAMAAMLMVAAGLLIKSLWNLQNVDPGFTPAGVLKAEFQLPPSRYPTDFSKWPNWPAHHRFFDEVTARLAALPGVEAVTIAGANPLDAGFTSSIRVVGREAEASDWPEPSIRTVSLSYLNTLRIPLIEGRTFEALDTAAVTGQPVAMLNQAANQRYFGGHGAIGQRINLWGADRSVIGIVGNERFKGLTEAAPPAVYLPLTQAPQASAVLVRTTGDPRLVAPAVRRVVRDVDPLLAVFGVEPLTETLGNTQAQRRFTMLLLGTFAAVALLLAAIGVHGVLSYSVLQRTREIGIRAALGADVAQIGRLVLSQGAVLASCGIAAGLGGAFVLTRLLSTLLFGVGARDALTFAGVAIVLAAVALVAVWLPARRATRVDPMVALRHE